jgi:hypothetical protein
MCLSRICESHLGGLGTNDFIAISPTLILPLLHYLNNAPHMWKSLSKPQYMIQAQKGRPSDMSYKGATGMEEWRWLTRVIQQSDRRKGSKAPEFGCFLTCSGSNGLLHTKTNMKNNRRTDKSDPECGYPIPVAGLGLAYGAMAGELAFLHRAVSEAQMPILSQVMYLAALIAIN